MNPLALDWWNSVERRPATLLPVDCCLLGRVIVESTGGVEDWNAWTDDEMKEERDKRGGGVRWLPINFYNERRLKYLHSFASANSPFHSLRRAFPNWVFSYTQDKPVLHGALSTFFAKHTHCCAKEKTMMSPQKKVTQFKHRFFTRHSKKTFDLLMAEGERE